MASQPTTGVAERFGKLVSTGISYTSDDTDKIDYFKDYQQSSIEYKNGSYTVKLPWKRDHPGLPCNYDVSEKINLIGKLQGESSLLKKYDKIISEQERRGFIEKVNSKTPPNGPLHYIPHQSVKRLNDHTHLDCLRLQQLEVAECTKS